MSWSTSTRVARIKAKPTRQGDLAKEVESLKNDVVEMSGRVQLAPDVDQVQGARTCE